jgi:hypothetical protein
MASALRLYFLLLIVLVPIGGQAGPLIVDQVPGEKVFMTVSDTADSPQITVLHTILVQENDLRDPSEETQEEEEEEEPSDSFRAAAFQYPLVDCRPEWNAFVFHQCGPQLFKRYLHFHALKLFC